MFSRGLVVWVNADSTYWPRWPAIIVTRDEAVAGSKKEAKEFPRKMQYESRTAVKYFNWDGEAWDYPLDTEIEDFVEKYKKYNEPAKKHIKLKERFDTAKEMAIRHLYVDGIREQICRAIDDENFPDKSDDAPSPPPRPIKPVANRSTHIRADHESTSEDEQDDSPKSNGVEESSN